MDPAVLSPRLPALAAALELPWFILWSIARVRMGGTSARPLVRLIDLIIPLPAVLGVVVAAMLLFKAGGAGGPWLWGGALACAGLSALFAWVLLH